MWCETPTPGGVFKDSQTQGQDTLVPDRCEGARRQSEVAGTPSPPPTPAEPPGLGAVPQRTEDIGKCSRPTEDRWPVARPPPSRRSEVVHDKDTSPPVGR